MMDRMQRARDARGLIKRTEIVALAQRIQRRFKPLRIVLFGSYAWGHPNRDSDIDLFIVMRTHGDIAQIASQIRCAVDPPFPLDLVVRTPIEVRRRLAEGDAFIREVIERGRVLHDARHARVG